jgi:hypothetical protein
VDLPSEAPEEPEPAQGHVRNRSECPSPANMKRPRICPAESGQILAATRRTHREGNATHSYCSVETDASHDEEDPEPSLVPRSVLICSDPDEDVVQEEATPNGIPAGWTRTKLEPDW